jgi:hypothetical protein
MTIEDAESFNYGHLANLTIVHLSDAQCGGVRYTGGKAERRGFLQAPAAKRKG